MSTIKTFIFSLIFILALNNLSTACDFLSVNIGGNKSEIEKYFGTIEFDEEIDEADETKVTDIPTVSMPADILCPNTNLGHSIIHVFIVDDIIAGISIEVINGTNNEESKKRLLYKYVTGNYGSIENSDSPNWTGYKIWNIGGRKIIYTKMYHVENFMLEELQITNPEYMSYLIDNEPFDTDDE
jgi:hypothetical protein